MHRTWVIASVAFVLVATFAVLLLKCPSDRPITVAALSTEAAGDEWNIITVEFKQLTNVCLRIESVQIKSRIAGRWGDFTEVPVVVDPVLFGASPQFMEGIPAQAESCSVVVRYRVGGSPYCRFYGYLASRGLYKRFPKACKLALKLVPHKPRLRQAEFELNIPKQPQPSVAI